MMSLHEVATSRSAVRVDNEGRTVLVVDDEEAFRDRLVRALRQRGFDASGVASAEEAARASERSPALSSAPPPSPAVTAPESPRPGTA